MSNFSIIPDAELHPKPELIESDAKIVEDGIDVVDIAKGGEIAEVHTKFHLLTGFQPKGGAP